jgi:UDP-2,3-diacylglucosamine pyrophosphatase LpxH
VGQKLKFVLSDLHLGAGHAENGENRLEDFAATREFVAFLDQVSQESYQDDREVELIVNGDLFEFLQVPAVDDYDPTLSYPVEAYLDSSQAASVKRLNIIVEGHQRIFDALSDFMHIERPQRHITIIKGNHDVSLFWPGVKSRLREVLGASGARASLLRFADEFVSREKIYVEHGHQRAEKLNAYPDSFDPRSTDDPMQLYQPAGSCFVIEFFNEVERQWQFIDQIKPIPTIIWYGLHWNFDFAAKALACFIRQAPLREPDPNLSLLFPTEVLLQQFENEQQRSELSQQYAQDALFRQKFHEQVHQYLYNVTLDNKGMADLPPTKVTADPLEMGLVSQKQQRMMLHQAAERITDQEKAKVILFGHTHEPVQELLSNGCAYINTGSWIKDFSRAPLRTWEMLFSGTQPQSHLLADLPYARIDYDKNDYPQARLLYFNAHSAEPTPPVTSETLLEAQAGTQNFFEKNMQRLFRRLRMSS